MKQLTEKETTQVKRDGKTIKIGDFGIMGELNWGGWGGEAHLLLTDSLLVCLHEQLSNHNLLFRYVGV